MGVINVLDKHIADLIAAGEVVERPASAIKELVENSIDAGAKNITVEIKNGGTTFMRVTDDGCGIMRDDVKVAFLPHATSKIKMENDLDRISTLGFRGEALASISAVSRLQILTRHKSEEIGVSYEINGGEEGLFDDAGCPVGTTIIIRDLFFNIPARMKFLKKDVSEGNAVANVIDKVALSHPEISFTFIRDGKQTLKTSGDSKLKSSIYSVFGRDFANSLIPVDFELDNIKVQGFISKPINARPNRGMQNFFINGRFVKSRTATAALEEASKGSVMIGKFPACVLHLTLSYEAIDVNVHPSKIEVRFINEKPIFNAVYHAVKNALKVGDQRKQIIFENEDKQRKTSTVFPFTTTQAVINEKKSKENYIKSLPVKNDPISQLDNIAIKNTHPFSPLALNDNFSTISQNIPIKEDSTEIISDVPDDTQNIETGFEEKNNILALNEASSENQEEFINNTKSEEPQIIIEQEKNTLRLIGEAFKTYILVEKNDKEIVIIDKHAAHERIIYEKLKKERGTGYSQRLLQPIAVVLNKIDYDSAINNLDLFEECAFEIEDFGSGTLLVRSVPQYLQISDIEESVIEMASHISQNHNDIRSAKMDWIYHNVACRAAIKGGNNSTEAELIDLANQLDDDPTLRYCPHGRPVCVVMSKYELEKQFGRV